MFCHAVLFLHISSHYLPVISSEDSFESCDIEEAAGSQRKSEKVKADLVVQPSLTSDLSLGALIHVRLLSLSSGNTNILLVSFQSTQKEPPEFYSFTTFSVKLLEILFNSNSQCTNKSSAMWNQSSWFICSHCACKTENKVARRHFPQCKIHL